MKKNAKKIITYHDEYLTSDEYLKNSDRYPYAWVCQNCDRIIKNSQNFSIPDVCEECKDSEM